MTLVSTSTFGSSSCATTRWSLPSPRSGSFAPLNSMSARTSSERLRRIAGVNAVVIDPLRQFGEPLFAGVRTDIVAEQYRAGETVDGIGALFDLDRAQVEAALRYELIRNSPEEPAA